ncbi:MAG: PQQ-binding-like beta-propeller repeat protein [Planctomycetota bacterium]|jgi:outer membrane protein assembly factor BamB
MKSASRWGGVIVAALVFVVAAGAFAQEWPQWRGPDRSGKVTGFTAPETWPDKLAAKWKVTVGAGDSTPALVGERLYVFSRQAGDEVILCLDAASGDELWRHKSSPAVAEGKVVTLGVGGILMCLDADSGKEIWRKDEFPKVVPKYFTSMSPVIVDGTAIAHLGGEGNGALMAFDLSSGDLKWKWDGEGPAYSSPVLMTVESTRQVVTMTEKSVVGIGAADGKLLWQVPFAAMRRAYNAATPIVEGDTVYFTGQGRGTTAVKVEKEAEGFAAKELWSNPDVAVQFNTPVLKDALLFGLSSKGFFFCLDAETGQTAWTDTTNRGGSFAAVVDAGSAIIALPGNSELTVFKPDREKYAELARIKVADTATYAHPVIAGNRIFVKDQETLALLTIE